MVKAVTKLHKSYDLLIYVFLITRIFIFLLHYGSFSILKNVSFYIMLGPLSLKCYHNFA